MTRSVLRHVTIATSSSPTSLSPPRRLPRTPDGTSRHCRSGTDASVSAGRGDAQPVLPISSTPLPFQWNRTTLFSPLVPLAYISATVSPVVAVSSMPLKP